MSPAKRVIMSDKNSSHFYSLESTAQTYFFLNRISITETGYAREAPPWKIRNTPLDEMRQMFRCHPYSYRTELSLVSLVKRYILFHDNQHPQDID